MLPSFPTCYRYPIANQVADKVRAMDELHGTAGYSSGRFRDLVDLILVIRMPGRSPAELLGQSMPSTMRKSRSTPSERATSASWWA